MNLFSFVYHWTTHSGLILNHVLHQFLDGIGIPQKANSMNCIKKRNLTIMDSTSVFWQFWNGIHSLLSLCEWEFIGPEIHRKDYDDCHFQLSSWGLGVGSSGVCFYAFGIAECTNQSCSRGITLPLSVKKSVPCHSILWFWISKLFVGRCTENYIPTLK